MSNDNPLGQAISLLTRVQGKGVSAGTLEAHFSAGLVSDLFEVADPAVVDREAFRKFLGLGPLELITEIDFGQTLPQMIAAAGNDWVNNDITAERFPVVGSGIKRFRNKMFAFPGNISSEAGVAAMKKEKFEPATHVHGFAFSAKFPDVQRKNPFACLGSSARVNGHRGVVCFGGSGAGRGASLGGWGGDWPDRWRLLGVQEISGA